MNTKMMATDMLVILMLFSCKEKNNPENPANAGASFNSMKTVLVFLCCFFLFVAGYGQSKVFVLSDSSRIEGTIVTNDPTADVIVVQLKGGTHREIYRSALARIEEPKVDLSEYGGPFSIGVFLGGGGVVGLPIRFFPDPRVPIEIGIALRPVISGDNMKVYLNTAFMGDVGFYFSRKPNIRKNRIQMNGMFIRGGCTVGSRFNSILGMIGWAYERQKLHQKNYSVSLQLGLGLERIRDMEFYPDMVPRSAWDMASITSYSPIIYWKVAWNFFVVKKKKPVRD